MTLNRGRVRAPSIDCHHKQGETMDTTKHYTIRDTGDFWRIYEPAPAGHSLPVIATVARMGADRGKAKASLVAAALNTADNVASLRVALNATLDALERGDIAAALKYARDCRGRVA